MSVRFRKLRFLGLGIFVCATVIIGLFAILPEGGTRFTEASLGFNPESVYRTWVDYANLSKWHPAWKEGTSEELESTDGKRRWRVKGDGWYFVFENSEENPGRKVVSRIVDTNTSLREDLIFEISPTATGSHVRVTEKWVEQNYLDRLYAHLIVQTHSPWYQRHMASVYAALGQQLAQTKH